MTIEDDQFALVCYLALMQSGAGLLDKHPIYIKEKQYLLDRGLDAFAALDMSNMRRVMEWAAQWGVEVPEEVSEYFTTSVEAETELRARGMDI